MPIVVIYGNDDMDIDARRKMVEEVTESVSKGYDLPKEVITVLVEELSHENIGVAGKLLSDKE